MTVVRWQISDPDEDDTWVFPMNPKAGALPDRQKTITAQSVSASDAQGAVLLFEGADAAPKISWNGTILTQDFYDDMNTWFDKRRQVQLTDDLNNTWWVYLTKFTPKRINKHNYPWAMTYDAEVMIIDWPAP